MIKLTVYGTENDIFHSNAAVPASLWCFIE